MLPAFIQTGILIVPGCAFSAMCTCPLIKILSQRACSDRSLCVILVFSAAASVSAMILAAAALFLSHKKRQGRRGPNIKSREVMIDTQEQTSQERNMSRMQASDEEIIKEAEKILQKTESQFSDDGAKK